MEPADFKIQQQKTPYKCPRFEVEETTYTVDNNTRKTFSIRPSGDFLVIIGHLKDKILFIKSESPPHPVKQWTFPIGFLTPGVALADTAQTVLLENTGTVAQRFIYIGKFYPSKYINAIAHVVLGEGLGRLKDRQEEFKDKVTLFSQKEVGSLLINRSLGDGLTLASYVYYVTSEHYWTEVHDARNPNRRRQAGS